MAEKIKRYFPLAILLVAFIMIAGRNKPVQIFIAGDSTAANKVLYKYAVDTVTGDSVRESFMERGWGQLLPDFLNDKAIVRNHAKNGRSTGTFISEGLWDKLIDDVKKGDFVVLQFGHNDMPVEKKSHTTPEQFRNNFKRFILEIRQKGAYPILCTPVSRRKFNENGQLEATHGQYPEIIREIANEEKLPLIDMEKLTAAWLKEEGVEKSYGYFHKYLPGVSKIYPKGLDDNTHFNEAGARKVASLFIGEMQKINDHHFQKLIKNKK